ncbi:hypothetical protein LOTGIDRAFT_160035 [Lottia gigantea]|uniref:Uncharacterized protein n=1 Tax=Lottia gigantea TaxID=225164 RepID=V4AMQ1_LOTGI|nr:hypothetical protein LOTGIDRAFT_160035 [Lottia gigantea]ESO96050.1 hypothetical protein LOTGIDRAFT_160035 [Lottia gigantea]
MDPDWVPSSKRKSGESSDEYSDDNTENHNVVINPVPDLDQTIHPIKESGAKPGKVKTRNPRRTNAKVLSAKEFLNELPKLQSHYCRASSKKSYLEPIFTNFAELYRVYKDYCCQKAQPILGKKAFKSIIVDLNLSLFYPIKDQCDICYKFRTDNITEAEYNAHECKTSARDEKCQDKLLAESNHTIKVVTLNLQLLLL